MALIHALDNALQVSTSSIYIFSDSLSILSAISSNKTYNKKSFLILKILNLSYELEKQGKSLKIFWIPVHKDIGINESVDFMAKNRYNQRYRFPNPYPPFILNPYGNLTFILIFLNFYLDLAQLKASTFLKNFINHLENLGIIS